MIAALALVGCGFVTRQDRDLRWDLDQDGVERPADCDDQDPAVSPRAVELCDPGDRDEDCDGLADDQDPSAGGQVPYCMDQDGDGLGDPGTATPSCDPLPGWVADCTDPDDRLPITLATGSTGSTGGTGSTGDTGGCGDPPVAELTLSGLALEVGGTVQADALPGARGLRYQFQWGDGSPDADGALASASHTFLDPGFRPLTLVVTDPCGQSSAAEQWVAVAAVGSLVVVTTDQDQDDGSSTGYGLQLSLREALKQAKNQAGTQVITFRSGLTAVAIGLSMPNLEDPGGVLIGDGVVVDGSAGGRLDLDGADAAIYGLVLEGFQDAKAALQLTGVGSTARAVTVQGGGFTAVRLEGASSALVDSTVSGNGDPQVEVRAAATVAAEVTGGVGVGIRVDADQVRLERCRVHHNVGAGVSIARDSDDVSILDSTLAYNADAILVDKKVGDLDLRNLVLAFNSGWGLAGHPDGFAAGGPDFDLWFGNTLGDCEDCVAGGASVFADPLLDAELRPQLGSPAIDAGTSATGVDRTGPLQPAYFGGAPDLGAVEVR